MGDDDEAIEKHSSAKPSPDSLCPACATINGAALLQTRPIKSGQDYIHYNEAGELEVQHHTLSVPGIYHTLVLPNPASTVETCAACRLWNSAVYSGITLSEPAVLRLCLQQKRDLVDVEDVGKVEREKERAEKANEIANLDGKGTVSIFTDFGTVAAQEYPRRTIGESGSELSIACIRRWISECDANHSTCRLGLVGDVVDLEPQMPTRVIDVVSFEGNEAPRLLETGGLRGRYIAVSHSWGTVVQPYTTMKILESLKQSIDFESLPKTFRDSIFIARKLGVRYVWIDSICIIQDNYEDWKREAKTMGLVYEKAYLTISASESPGDDAGFLTPNPQVKMDVMLPFELGCPASGHIYLRSQYTGVINPQSTALSRRGWVLQERTLSRRILHFDGMQVHWECSQYRVSESGAKEDITGNVNTSYFLGQNIRPLAGRRSGDDLTDPTEHRKALQTLYHFYACKIHEFSACKLTRASDKLLAILGLGNEISRGTGIPCLEGHLLFEEPLFVYSLLWHTEIFGIQGSAIPAQVRAPSWSWAAMEGPRVFHLLGQDIEFERRFFLTIKRVLELDQLTLKPHNALLCLGRVTAGMKGDPFKYPGGSLAWNSRQFHEDPDEFQPPTFAYRLLDPAGDNKPRFPWGSSGKGWVCFDSMEARPEDFFFIPVCAPPAGEERSHPTTTRGCLGLVVVKASVEEQHAVSGFTNIYKRVGFGGLNGTSWFDQRDEVDLLLL